LQLGVLLRLLNLDGSFLKNHCHPLIRSMERETGIEPATNSLEGCDSTTELLPPFVPLSHIHRGPSLGQDFGARLKRRAHASTWKAVTLPLSYSRRRKSRQHSAVSLQQKTTAK